MREFTAKKYFDAAVASHSRTLSKNELLRVEVCNQIFDAGQPFTVDFARFASAKMRNDESRGFSRVNQRVRVGNSDFRALITFSVWGRHFNFRSWRLASGRRGENEYSNEAERDFDERNCHRVEQQHNV